MRNTKVPSWKEASLLPGDARAKMPARQPAECLRYNDIEMISVLQLGRIDYASGLRLQQKLVEARKSGQIGDVLVLLEHTPVITLGRNAKAANVLASAELLAARGVEVFECDRGGDVTFHGPGQLVGYPIFDLRGFSRQPTTISHQPSTVSHREEQSEAAAGSLPTWRKTLGAVDYVRRLEDVSLRRGLVPKRKLRRLECTFRAR